MHSKVALILVVMGLLATGAAAQTYTGIINHTNVMYDARSSGLVADGVTDDSGHINSAISTAVTGNYGGVQLPCGRIMLNNGINLTNLENFIFSGCGTPAGPGTNGSDPSNANSTELLCNTGRACIDLTGAQEMILSKLYLRAASSYSNPSTVGILDGRDNAGGGGGGNMYCYSQFNRIERMTVFLDDIPGANSGQGTVAFYNIGAEQMTLFENKFIGDRPMFFSATNDMSISSQYQTFASGCPASMTMITAINNSVTGFAANTTPFIDIRNADDFKFINQHTIAGRTNVTGSAFEIGDSSNIFINGQIENLNPTSPAGGSVLTFGNNADHIDLNVATSATDTGSGSWISFAASGLTISDSHFRVNVINGTNLPMFENVAETINGGDIDLTTTVTPNNLSSIAAHGTLVRTAGASSDISFASGSTYTIIDKNDTTVVGPLVVNGTVSKSGGSFRIDHPLDPANKYLYHSFVESPDMMNVYNGVVKLNARGEATVKLPEYFEALNQDFRYQLTPVGRYAPIYVARKIKGNSFHIAGGKPGLEVSWMVTGIRHDDYANAHRIQVEVDKPAAERGQHQQ